MQRDVVVPQDVQPSIYEALRQMRLMIKDTQTPILRDKKSLIGIAEGTSAFFIDENTLYRYTKINGKLIREDVSGEIDVDAVKKLADEQIAAAPAAPIRRANILETVDIGNSRDASVEFYYDILEKDLEDEESLPTSFSVEFYASSAHFEAKTPQIPEAQRPNAIVWTPTEPYQTLGTHIEKLEFYIRSTEYNPIYLNIVVE